MSKLPANQGLEPKDSVQFKYTDKTESYFTDIVQIKVSQDTVVLTFGQRDMDDMTKAEATHKVYISIAHFLRLTEVCNATAKRIIDEINKPQNKG